MQTLLRVRLKAAAIVLCGGFGLFLIRSYYFERPLQGLHTMLVFAAGVMVSLLASPREFSMKQLRLFELTLFGGAFLFFVPYMHWFMYQEAVSGDPVLTLAAFKSVTTYWLVTMVFYGMIVPNTWKRAAIIFAPLSLAPPLTAFLSRYRHETIAAVMSWDQITDTLLILIVASFCAVYGTYVMNSLRQEVFEAKQYGQYRLIRPLGEGGMGQVFLAEHRLLKRPCAIKLIHSDQAGDATALLRFEREVRTTAKLTHWNTIDIYDYGRTDDGTFYYAMEYLPGLNLLQLVQKYGVLSSARVVHLMTQTCRALKEAHDAGLIHRDLKASNIVVTRRGGMYDVAKLLDFGLVKSVGGGDELTATGSVAGTPEYMAPEQGFGEKQADERSDIYALGCVMYLLVGGRVPFKGDSAVQTLIAQSRDRAVPPIDLRNDLSSQLNDVILKCLQKDSDGRYQTAGDLADALEGCSDMKPWTQRDAELWWKAANEPLEAPSLHDMLVPSDLGPRDESLRG